MNTQFEWSDGGRELLKVIEAEIAKNGGRYRTHCKLQREANRRIYKFKQVEVPISINSIIFNNWHKLMISEISNLVGLPIGTVYWRGRWLGLPTKGRSLSKHNEKMVFNTQTGIYYDSIKDAWKTVGGCYKTLSRKLKGDCNNNTSFVRI